MPNGRKWSGQVHTDQNFKWCLRKDAGRIMIEGRPVHFKSPQDAQNMGIGTVFQEIALCSNLTVAGTCLSP